MKSTTILTILIVAGMVIGALVGEFVLSGTSVGGDHWTKICGDLILIRPLKLLVIPLVLFSVVAGITRIGDPRALGRLGSATLVYYFATMLIAVTIGTTLVQIMLLDLVFSLDSVITAVGMVERIEVMIIAVVISVLLMVIFARSVGRFVNDHPTIKVLALSFLLLIGMALVADGLEVHIPKGYIYFAMGFSLFVEMLNLKVIALKTAAGKKAGGDQGEA